MNKILIIIAFALFLKPAFPVADYIVNYDYIVKELCENKDNPTLNCNGKCHLKKELASASSDNESTNAEHRLKIAKQEILYITIIEEFLFTTATAPTAEIKDSYINFYCLNKSNSIFHPPLFH